MASGDGILGIQKSSEIKLPSGARLKYQENSSGFGILKKILKDGFWKSFWCENFEP